MNIAIIGAGLIGTKRAAALDESDRLIIICDNNLIKAKELASIYSAKYTDCIQDVIDLTLVRVGHL